MTFWLGELYQTDLNGELLRLNVYSECYGYQECQYLNTPGAWFIT